MHSLMDFQQIFDQGNQRIGVVQRTEPEQNLAPPPAQGGSGA
jgi:hypothetical protein